MFFIVKTNKGFDFHRFPFCFGKNIDHQIKFTLSRYFDH